MADNTGKTIDAYGAWSQNDGFLYTLAPNNYTLKNSIKISNVAI